VFSIDAFRPMIDDPYVFGRIAANHCLGDLFAVGAEAQTALAIATLPLWPDAKLVAELRQMLTGAVDVLDASGAALVGGHTSEGAELSLGFAVTGWIARERLLTKTGLRPGDALILTKPLGTGTLLAANMRARAKGRWIDAAIETMLQSNRGAGEILRAHGAAACTDVTGFGLAGHLLEMIGAQSQDARDAANLGVRLDFAALPVLDGAPETIGAGIVSTLHAKNERAASASIGARLRGPPLLALLFDPQTAGGLLAGIPLEQAADCVAALRGAGYAGAAVIGRVVQRASDDRVRIDQLT
jgi:selenide,water dikinase